MSDENESRKGLPERHEEDGESREDLLNSFLSRIGMTPDKATEEETPEEFSFPSVSEYPGLKAGTSLEKKIRELKKISAAIEKRKVETGKLSAEDFRDYKINYYLSLNPAQLAAVLITEKPVLVIAGAGSGKTRVIVHRVSWLIEKEVDPSSILLLTFTRKAAKEMLERVEVLLKDKRAGKVTGGTFHSFAAFVLRRYANMIGLPSNFTIIDTGDSEDIIDLIRTELKFNTVDKKFPRKGRIYDIISIARNKDRSIRKIIETQYSGLKGFTEDIEMIHSAYQKYKKASRILDFDDLMEVLRDSLRNNMSFRKKLQDRYGYIMVDEYQDTNVVQKEIVDLLAAGHRRVMVVGDDSQSIYSFRGANYENILRFPEKYPDCALVRIEENYRSNQKILDFTNSIIENAKIGYRKNLFSKNLKDTRPLIKQLYSQEDEAIFIVDRIMELVEQDIPLNEIAVLNRADWHNRYIQAELNKRGIPYVVVGGFRFNERMHIRDIIAYLRICYNPSDAVAWHRVLKHIGGVGKITAGSVVRELLSNNDDFNFESFRKRKFYNELLALGEMLSRASRPEFSLTAKVEIIREYYAPLLRAREDDYAERMKDVDVLIDLSKKYKDLDRFLADFALDPPSKRIAEQTTPLIDEGEEKGKVTLSTVHSAKGLEWYAVFIPHALEGLFPSNRAANLEEMEEERRLFYVACSRAKEELYITFPRNILSYDAFFHLPSRFLAEIDEARYHFERQ